MRPLGPVVVQIGQLLFVVEDPRKVVIAAVLLEAQAHLGGPLVDLKEEVEVDLHPLWSSIFL